VARVVVTRRLPEAVSTPSWRPGMTSPTTRATIAFSEADCGAAAADTDAIVCLLTDPVDAEVLAAGAGRLQVVANVAVGYDNIDLAAAAQHGVAVCNTPGVLDETTADLAFLLILAASRLAGDAARDLRDGRWPGWGSSSTSGATCTRPRSACRLRSDRPGRRPSGERLRDERTPSRPPRHGPTGLRGIARRAAGRERRRVVARPAHPRDRHLLDAGRLARLRPSAVLVNTARGPVVDEAALAAALESGQLFAAGLDVYEREPEIDPRLLAATRTVLLPHIGSASQATRTRMARLACEGVVAVLRGEQPPNLVSAAPARSKSES